MFKRKLQEEDYLEDMTPKKKSKKFILFVVIMVTLIIAFAGYIVNSQSELRAKMKEPVQIQLDLYTNKLLPVLMNNCSAVKVSNIHYDEVTAPSGFDYAIRINCDLMVNKTKYDYPIIVKFQYSDVNNPKYEYNDALGKTITNQINALKEEEEKQSRLNSRVSVTARELYKAYDKNEVQADAEYKGKTGDVNGTVRSISTLGDSVYIGLSDSKQVYMDLVTCEFSDKSSATMNKLKSLKKGDKVVIEGEINGWNVINVRLENCSFY